MVRHGVVDNDARARQLETLLLTALVSTDAHHLLMFCFFLVSQSTFFLGLFLVLVNSTHDGGRSTPSVSSQGR